MNYQNHLISAAAALFMTTATFAGIGGYAQHVSAASRAAAPLQAVATAQIDRQLQRQPHQTEREVVDNVQSTLPQADADLPTVTVIAHRSRTA